MNSGAFKMYFSILKCSSSIILKNIREEFYLANFEGQRQKHNF